MEKNGIYWKLLEKYRQQIKVFCMLEFCGEDRCLVDANGRVRLNQRLVNDFLRKCEGNVVMYVLPEGAVALYPEETYRQMREREISDADNVGSSFSARRSLRRFGSLTHPETITRQGRVTLPERFRSMTGLNPGVEACVIGVEIGVEIWTAERFENEMMEIDVQLAEQKKLEYKSMTGGEV